MANAVYILCALTSITCAALLLRGFVRTRARLLMWSSLCFFFLGINNVLLLLDKIVFPELDYILGVPFMIWRTLAALIGLSLLLIGLIIDVD